MKKFLLSILGIVSTLSVTLAAESSVARPSYHKLVDCGDVSLEFISATSFPNGEVFYLSVKDKEFMTTMLEQQRHNYDCGNLSAPAASCTIKGWFTSGTTFESGGNGSTLVIGSGETSARRFRYSANIDRATRSLKVEVTRVFDDSSRAVVATIQRSNCLINN